MALKPWYKVVTPREDLREGRPLDAAEFAVHLDQVRDGRAPEDYRIPERFFARTYLTRNLTGLAVEVIRRLSGITTETSAIFNMTTQFGGGKTHALTLLYHLAQNGPAASNWPEVDRLLSQAGVRGVPRAATAVFVGTEFDSLTGRGGSDGTPLRRTPWGEIAFQLAGVQGLAAVAEQEEKMIAPAGDVIRKFLPQDRPCLILMDELMNYVSRYRRMGLSAQLYDFLQNLSETARGMNNVVLAVSIPASELEMTAEDQSDYERFKKLLDRLGKAVVMSAEAETSEIIRRRLFEWDPRAVGQDGRVLLNRDAHQVCAAYTAWVVEHRQQLPGWFPVDNAQESFLATYPFHPTVLSVFERKWQALPRFQQTRGILRLLALWVSRAYRQGFQGAHRDPLISLGTAPLEDPLFRAAVFEQLGESRLEAAVTTDICGKADAHAVRLDKEAVEAVTRARLHRKVATTIFFESNGGQARGEATVPEIRLAVAEPDLDIGHIETVLETLASSCYYLTVDRNRYRFSLSPNLNKLLADRRANIRPERIDERVKDAVREVFPAGQGVEIIYFPGKSSEIPNRPALTLAVLAPEQSLQDPGTLRLVDTMTREYGSSSRTFKSALIWAVADSDAALREEARRLLAWEDIKEEEKELRLDDTQKQQLEENLKKAHRDLKECAWRSYKNIALLGKDNSLRVVDLGLVHSSAAESMVALILNRLRQEGDVEDGVSPNFLVRNWPPAFKEWSMKAVRDAFYASPQFPRLLKPESLKETVARGVAGGIIAYVGKAAQGGYHPFYFNTSLPPETVEFSEDMFIVTAEEVRRQIEPPKLSSLVVSPSHVQVKPGEKYTFTVKGLDQYNREIAVENVAWSATGGIIDRQGVFQADEGRGSYVVTADASGVSGSARVTVIEMEEPGGQDTLPPTGGPVPPRKAGKMLWTGDVPPRKWMNFYTKVLAKFAGSPGLKITVSIEVSPEDGISEQKVEETRLALLELGLDEDITLG
ncbi:ATP-binding protein [Thermodesulfitimonas autotrophica]|uniref:ATP-binding protein n=1 Tax=Thermodesulfitimonas autotrophica TaxID=1894989 RepID=UPI002FE4239A